MLKNRFTLGSRITAAVTKTSMILWQGLVTKRPHMAYVGGWLGNQNLGDEALYKAAKKLFPQCGFIQYPYHGGRAVTIPAKTFGIFKYGLLAGGTIIYKGQRSLRVVTECFRASKDNLVFGTGVANPSFWYGRKDWTDLREKWRALLGRCRYVGVRGPLSAQLLNDVGISNVEVIGDPVLAFADGRPDDDTAYIPYSIGLNIGQSYGNVWGSEELIHTEFVKLARLAKQADWKVRWFVVFPEDLELTRQTAQASGTTSEIYEIYEDYTRYINLVRPMSTFVGVKLHAVALATCAYVPSIMLEYRPKCRDYMQAIGQDEATIRTDHFRAEEVWEIIKNWNSQRSRLSNLLYEAIRPICEKQHQKANELFKDLESSKWLK